MSTFVSVALVVLLAAIALLFGGISSIIAGLRGEKRKEIDGSNSSSNSRHTVASTGSRALSVAAGALALALSIMIMASPLLFGIALAAFVIGIAVLVYGMRLVVTGIYGRKGRDYEIYNVSTKSYIAA